MDPRIIPEHTDREIESEMEIVWIVMDDGSNPGQNVLVGTPEEPEPERHAKNLLDFPLTVLLNVGRPIDIIPVRRLSQVRKEIEFEMIVAVDETRDHALALKRNYGVTLSHLKGAVNVRNDVPRDSDITNGKIVFRVERPLLEQEGMSRHCFRS